MTSLKVNLCFEFHHPLQLKKISNPSEVDFSDLNSSLFDSNFNKEHFSELREKTYLPTLRIIEELINTFKNQKKSFKVSLNVSGVFLDYCESDPELMEILKNIANSGCVEFLGSTYYHSLSSLMSEREFGKQVNMHSKKIKDLFNQETKTFVNTNLIFNSSVAEMVKKLGFESIITEGHEHILDYRNPNSVYISKNGLKVVLRNKRLSDDIGLRFSAKGWNEWPLTSEKYSYWVSASPGDVVTIYLDIKNFGIYNKEEDGIFWFLKALPWKLFEHDNVEFSTPANSVRDSHPVGQIKLFENEILSWAGVSPVNDMQKKYLKELQDLGSIIEDLQNPELTNVWRLLQMTDHYTNGYGLHNFSNVLELMRNSISGLTQDLKPLFEKPKDIVDEPVQEDAEEIEEPVQEPHQYVPDEKKLFFVDEFLDQKISNLEFISNSLKRRSVAS